MNINIKKHIEKKDTDDIKKNIDLTINITVTNTNVQITKNKKDNEKTIQIKGN